MPHFRVASLVSVGAWDEWNVTEDADLGIRLARFGYRVDSLDSDTWEEAPHEFGIGSRSACAGKKAGCRLSSSTPAAPSFSCATSGSTSARGVDIDCRRHFGRTVLARIRR